MYDKMFKYTLVTILKNANTTIKIKMMFIKIIIFSIVTRLLDSCTLIIISRFLIIITSSIENKKIYFKELKNFLNLKI
jgi:hypothetical protein